MKVVFLTLGSRGDVQPYVAVGQSLKERGHEVVICTGESFKDMIEKEGLSFVKAHADLMKMIETPEGQAIFNGQKMSLLKIMDYMKTVINPLFRVTFDDFYEAASGADILICHPKAMVAYDIAEAMSIPCISMPPVPMLCPTGAFPNLAVTPSRQLGTVFNHLSYKVTAFSESSSMRIINDFRRQTLQLDKRKMGAYSHFDVQPVIYPISPALFKEVDDWGDNLLLTGFPFLNHQEGQLDQDIEAFLKAGDKPWVITFSSMPAKGLEKIIVDSLNQRQERAIFIKGNSLMTFDHPNILVVKQAPHRLIFREAKGIIHHGGVGTTAEALLSGRPQHIIPFSVDQPFWANRLAHLGLMAQVVKPEKMTPSAFDSILDHMTSHEAKLKAQTFAQEIDVKSGSIHAAIAIERRVKDAQKDI